MHGITRDVSSCLKSSVISAPQAGAAPSVCSVLPLLSSVPFRLPRLVRTDNLIIAAADEFTDGTFANWARKHGRSSHKGRLSTECGDIWRGISVSREQSFVTCQDKSICRQNTTSLILLFCYLSPLFHWSSSEVADGWLCEISRQAHCMGTNAACDDNKVAPQPPAARGN